jgi:anti-sigma regulatory factor (Ser/Thr protein kinase)
MGNQWLTVSSVEDIQHAARRGVAVSSAIRKLSGATLPAILEYGCLRWQMPDLPRLPETVLSSPLGAALFKVVSPLGLRTTGQDHHVPSRVDDPPPCGFVTMKHEDDLAEQPWKLFMIRFTQSAVSTGFGRQEAHLLAVAMGEMADNALQHSASPVPILVGYRTFDGVAQFTVVDVGIGVLASLTGCDDYRHLRYHNEAIRAALLDGTTSMKGRGGGGFGFRQVFKALVEQQGNLRFRSVEGCITMDGRGLDADAGNELFPPKLPGFQVTVSCRTPHARPAEPVV